MVPWIRSLLVLVAVAVSTQSEAADHKARVVILGSGTPIPDPESSGPAIAIVANGQAYLFDAGAGIVRRAEEAAAKLKIPALEAPYLTRLFLTHLHSDHTLGYPDVILTPWVEGRNQSLEVFGPQGTAAMTQYIKLAYAEDIAIRTAGLEGLDPAALAVHVHEIEPGPVYRDANVTVRALAACHGSWKHAFGYAVDAGGRSIVISGDTTPCPALDDACHRCDVLIHEVYSASRFSQLPEGAKTYHSNFHTSTHELAGIAIRTKPKLLILYHQLYLGSREGVDLEKEVGRYYSGPVVNGHDLDVY